MRTLSAKSCWCAESDNGDDGQSWLEHLADICERNLRCHIELITLSCLLLASKLNE